MGDLDNKARELRSLLARYADDMDPKEARAMEARILDLEKEFKDKATRLGKTMRAIKRKR